MRHKYKKGHKSTGGHKPVKRKKIKGHGVLLAYHWNKKIDPTGYHMSEKLNGLRCTFNGSEFISRLGNVFAVPDWFKSGMPHHALDGELWIDRKSFKETSGIVRSSRKDSTEWQRIKFMVFDAPEIPGDFEKRYAAIGKMHLPSHVKRLEHKKCKGYEHLKEFLREVESKHGEGVMLRAPHSKYIRKRSKTLLKVKSFKDKDARVVGYEKSKKGKYRGQTGALIVKFGKGKRAKRVKVGSGLNESERKRPPRIGSKIIIKESKYTNPTYVGVRGD